MGIDGGQSEAAQALQLPRRVPVKLLGPVVEQGQRKQGQEDPGKAVAYHQQHAQQVEHSGQQDVEDEGQAVVHTIQVRREAVEDAAHWGGVEEGHSSLMKEGRR